jgi:hypothetical protein
VYLIWNVTLGASNALQNDFRRACSKSVSTLAMKPALTFSEVALQSAKSNYFLSLYQ